MMQKRKDKEEKPVSVDPFGSYTGQPADPGERPVQDADDL